MVSLFVLFSLFYKRKYSKKDGNGKNNDKSTLKESEDQCHKAMGDISVAAKEVAGHAAKDAGKFVASATKAVKRSNGSSRVGVM